MLMMLTDISTFSICSYIAAATSENTVVLCACASYRLMHAYTPLVYISGSAHGVCCLLSGQIIMQSNQFLIRLYYKCTLIYN